MFKIKAGTIIEIDVPKHKGSCQTSGWKIYTTKEDKFYNNDEVWDYVALSNGRDIPFWEKYDILEHNMVIFQRDNAFAKVHPSQIEYLD